MRRWIVELTNDEFFENRGKIVKVRANTIKGAIKKAFRKDKYINGKKLNIVYQISTRCKGCKLWQPVWDCYNGFLNKSKTKKKLLNVY